MSFLCAAIACPDCEALAAYVDRGLDRRERTMIERHIAVCRLCLQIVANVIWTVAELEIAGIVDRCRAIAESAEARGNDPWPHGKLAKQIRLTDTSRKHRQLSGVRERQSRRSSTADNETQTLGRVVRSEHFR